MMNTKTPEEIASKVLSEWMGGSQMELYAKMINAYHGQFKTPEASPSKQYYEAVPVEKMTPQNDGHYFVISGYGTMDEIIDTAYYRNVGWHLSTQSSMPYVEHWLRPIDLTQHDREVAELAFKAGWENGYDTCSNQDNNKPALEVYLNSIK